MNACAFVCLARLQAVYLEQDAYEELLYTSVVRNVYALVHNNARVETLRTRPDTKWDPLFLTTRLHSHKAVPLVRNVHIANNLVDFDSSASAQSSIFIGAGCAPLMYIFQQAIPTRFRSLSWELVDMLRFVRSLADIPNLTEIFLLSLQEILQILHKTCVSVAWFRLLNPMWKRNWWDKKIVKLF